MSTTQALAPVPNLADVYADEERRRRVEEIEQKMIAEGVKHVYFQYVNMQGRVVAKVVPTGYWTRAATKGLAWPYVVAGGFHVTSDLQLIGRESATGLEGLAVPDVDTFEVLPWDPRMARVFCTHYTRLEDEGGGQPAPDDIRAHLRRALNSLHEELGVIARSGCEPEMSWFRSREAVDASDSLYSDHVPPNYSVRHLEGLGEVLTKVTEYGLAMGFDMIQADYEDPSQLECNFGFDDFLTTADRLITYRQIALRVAEEVGMSATFMPKPVAGIMANGCHHHVSFWRGEENVFMDPSISARENLSEEGLHAVGGLLEHASGMMAVLAPTVNSYKRYLEPNWSPTCDTSWGYDNRACSLRVVPGRIEIRTPDSATNPYLSHLAIIAAIRDGWEKRIDPGAPQVGEEPPATNGSGPRFKRLPITLAEALDAFEADDVIKGALPGDVAEMFIAAKRDEWMRYCGAITDWDYDTYYNYIP